MNMDDIKKSEIKLESFFTKVLAVIGKTTEVEIANLLKEQKLTVSTAESITAGMISSRLTKVPGSSEYYIGGVICYHNRAKVIELGISPGLIAKKGVVSKEVAIAMAESIRDKLKTDIGIAITGSAGPAPEVNAPVGLIYIALASDKGSKWKKIHLVGTRSEIRSKAAQAALGLLWLHLGGDEIVQFIGED
ncbi:MAG: CinA family protein [bacterium]